MIHVVAYREVLPGCMEKFLKILMENLPNVLAEEGCLRYEPCFDAAEGPDADKTGTGITFVETWESEEHLQAHLKTAHMAAYFAAVEPLCGPGSSIKVLRPC